MKRILIMGATSAIAEATARRFALRGDALFLVARDGLRLQAIADDLKLRGAQLAGTHVLDARDLDEYPNMLDAAAKLRHNNARKTECLRGHSLLDVSNVYFKSDGGRQCRACVGCL